MTWDAENSMVMMWLVNSMDEEINSNYMCYPTAKEFWDNVNQMYSDLGNQSQKYELTLKLRDIRQGEDSITKYFNSLKRILQDQDMFDDRSNVWVDFGPHLAYGQMQIIGLLRITTVTIVLGIFCLV